MCTLHVCSGGACYKYSGILEWYTVLHIDFELLSYGDWYLEREREREINQKLVVSAYKTSWREEILHHHQLCVLKNKNTHCDLRLRVPEPTRGCEPHHSSLLDVAPKFLKMFNDEPHRHACVFCFNGEENTARGYPSTLQRAKHVHSSKVKISIRF